MQIALRCVQLTRQQYRSIHRLCYNLQATIELSDADFDKIEADFFSISKKNKKPQNTSTAASRKLLKNIKACRTGEEMLQKLQQNEKGADYVVVAHSLHRLQQVSKLGSDEQRQCLDILLPKLENLINQFNPLALCSSVQALGKMNYVLSENRLQMILSWTSQIIQQFDPSHCARMLHGFALMERRDKIDEIANIVLNRFLQFQTSEVDSSEISQAFWAVGTMGLEMSDEAKQKLVQFSENNLNDLDGVGYYNILQGMIGLNIHNLQFLQKLGQSLCDALQSEKVQFSPKALCNLLWAHAKLNYYNKQVFDLISINIQNLKDEEFNPQSIQNVAWACASVGHADQQLFNVLSQQSINYMDQFLPQHYSTLLSSCSKLGYFDKHFLEFILTMIGRNLHRFTPQYLATVAWALGTYGQRWNSEIRGSNGCITSIKLHSGRKLSQFQAQELSTILQAFSRLKCYDIHFHYKAYKRCQEVMSDFNDIDCSMLAWSMQSAIHEGHRDYYNEDTYEALCRRATALLPQFSTVNFVTMFTSLAKILYYDTVFVEQSIYYLQQGKWIDEMQGKETVNLLQAFAQYYLIDQEEIIENLLRRSEELFDELVDKDLVGILWSIGIFEWDKKEKDLMIKIAQQIARIPPKGTIIRQKLYHTFMMCEQREWWDLLSEDLRQQSENLWKLSIKQTAGSSTKENSYLHNQVIYGLKYLGLSPKIEHKIKNGAMSIDNAFFDLQGQGKVAVEVDGAHHFTRGQMQFLDGTTRARNRLLEKAGWKVASIAYFEWERLNSRKKRLDYLKRKLYFE